MTDYIIYMTYNYNGMWTSKFSVLLRD